MKLNMIGGFSKEFVDYYCLMEDAKNSLCRIITYTCSCIKSFRMPGLSVSLIFPISNLRT